VIRTSNVCLANTYAVGATWEDGDQLINTWSPIFILPLLVFLGSRHIYPRFPSVRCFARKRRTGEDRWRTRAHKWMSRRYVTP
jgi:hypothetical protein